MTYSEMKSSGIPWIGKIPTHWKITRSKIVFQNVTVKNHPDATVLSLYRDLGVLPKESRDDNHNVTSEDTAQYKFFDLCGEHSAGKRNEPAGFQSISCRQVAEISVLPP